MYAYVCKLSMSSQQESLKELHRKTDDYIRKFYLDEALRGLMFALAYSIGLFVLFVAAAYYMNLSSAGRVFLYYGFVFSTSLVWIRFVLFPLGVRMGIGRGMGREQAATYIGQAFPEVRDGLLNVLQLGKQLDGNKELIQAVIAQKVGELKPITFSDAVRFGNSLKYGIYALLPILLLAGLAFWNPEMIAGGSERLIAHRQSFDPPRPFELILENTSLSVKKGKDLMISVRAEGKSLPSEVYLDIAGQRIRMNRMSDDHFGFLWSNVQESLDFGFYAGGFLFGRYAVSVLPELRWKSFQLTARPLPYTRLPEILLQSPGAVLVPEGSSVSIEIKGRAGQQLEFLPDSNSGLQRRADRGKLLLGWQAAKPLVYSLIIREGKYTDTLTGSVQLIPDQYPVLEVVQEADSSVASYRFIAGDLRDDYGFSGLWMVHKLIPEDSSSRKPTEIRNPISFTAAATQSRFMHQYRLSDFALQPGDRLDSYVEVADNDRFHGPKYVRSQLWSYQMPGLKELEKQLENDQQALSADLSGSNSRTAQLQRETKALQEKLLNKKTLSWEDKKALEKLAQNQESLRKMLEEMLKKMEKNQQQQETLFKPSDELQAKQEMLKNLAQEVLNKEISELKKKIDELLNQLNKKEVVQQMEQMQAAQENLKNELERLEELYKRLDLEQRMEQAAAKLEKMAKEQEKLSERTSALPSKDADGMKEQQKQQNELKESAAQLKEDLAKMDRLAEDLKSQSDMEQVENQTEAAEKDMEEASEQMDQQQKDKASKSQKSAANKLSQAAQEMRKQQKQMQSEQQEEDMEALRQLLENLVVVSHDEEKLLKEVKGIDINAPRYVTLMQDQQKIRRQSVMIADSLYALASRIFSLKSYVTRQINEVNRNISVAISELEERNTFKAAGYQQYVMTGYNNLALMLSEAFSDMQQQMASQQQNQDPNSPPKLCKGGSCSKPGTGKKKSNSLSQMQKQLNDRMTKAGSQPNSSSKPGEKPGDKAGSRGMSKEFAEMAAEQADIRRKLEEMNILENKEGKGRSGDLGELIDLMDRTEKDLVNKRLTNEMLQRQQQISVKLLEAEKARKQQGEEEKRESQSAKDVKAGMPPSLEEYLKAKEAEADLYRKLSPDLMPFFKDLSLKYLQDGSQ